MLLLLTPPLPPPLERGRPEGLTPVGDKAALAEMLPAVGRVRTPLEARFNFPGTASRAVDVVPAPPPLLFLLFGDEAMPPVTLFARAGSSSLPLAMLLLLALFGGR